MNKQRLLTTAHENLNSAFGSTPQQCSTAVGSAHRQLGQTVPGDKRDR